jgi:hypothetical protein
MNTRKILMSGVLLVVASAAGACAQNKVVDDSPLFGDWSGESKCVGSNQNCHDEIVVYHISRSKADAKKINISADKIIDGKPDFMGAFDCDYDRDKQTLTSEFRIPRTGGKGVWLFHIDGDKMDGTLTVFPENEIGRRVKVMKDKAASKP